jgi:hypothetical protein
MHASYCVQVQECEGLPDGYPREEEAAQLLVLDEETNVIVLQLDTMESL